MRIRVLMCHRISYWENVSTWLGRKVEFYSKTASQGGCRSSVIFGGPQANRLLKVWDWFAWPASVAKGVFEPLIESIHKRRNFPGHILELRAKRRMVPCDYNVGNFNLLQTTLKHAKSGAGSSSQSPGGHWTSPELHH